MKKVIIFIALLIVSCSSEPSSSLFDISQHPIVDDCTPFEHAWEFFGEKEIKGAKSNDVITSFFRSMGFHSYNEDLSWCSVFMNAVHIQTSHSYTGKLNARSWVNYGKKVSNPKPGNIVVLWRESPSSWKGHVGFFIKYDKLQERVLVYGGNQSDRVTLSWYNAKRVLSFRESVISAGVSIPLDAALMEYFPDSL